MAWQLNAAYVVVLAELGLACSHRPCATNMKTVRAIGKKAHASAGSVASALYKANQFGETHRKHTPCKTPHREAMCRLRLTPATFCR